MEKLLFIVLIGIAFSASEDVYGPAQNYKHKDSDFGCGKEDFTPGSSSDCVDQLLWNKDDEVYYDHCCYKRYQEGGVMSQICEGLTEEQYLDIVETIRQMEKENRNLKIYQFDCHSSYLRYFASILLMALLF